LVVHPEWNVSALGGGQTRLDRIIAHDLYTIDPENDEQILDEAAEGYEFSRYLELPKTLSKCVQDCNVKGIKVRHKVKFNVQLHNPDGHISELRANLPVTLYISPSLPINENNDLVDQSPQASRAAIANDIANSAPPVYGQHTLDLLYSEVDRSGYRTPGMALSSPGTPYLHSRHASSDNLASLAAGGPSAPPVGNGLSSHSFVSPIALQSRLQDLRVGGGSADEDLDAYLSQLSSRDRSRRNSSHHDDYFTSRDLSNSSTPGRTGPHEMGGSCGPQSGTPSQQSSNAISRRTSEEDQDGTLSGAQTPFAQYDHMEDLAKVPSYSTAVKTPAPRRTTFGPATELPTYGDAVTDTSPPTLLEPPTAYIRSSPREIVATSPLNLSLASGRYIAHRNVSSVQDEERRLRLMQLRGR